MMMMMMIYFSVVFVVVVGCFMVVDARRDPLFLISLLSLGSPICFTTGLAGVLLPFRAFGYLSALRLVVVLATRLGRVVVRHHPRRKRTVSLLFFFLFPTPFFLFFLLSSFSSSSFVRHLLLLRFFVVLVRLLRHHHKIAKHNPIAQLFSIGRFPYHQRGDQPHKYNIGITRHPHQYGTADEAHMHGTRHLHGFTQIATVGGETDNGEIIRENGGMTIPWGFGKGDDAPPSIVTGTTLKGIVSIRFFDTARE